MIHRGPEGLSIPDESLPDFLLARARALGERAAIVDGVTGRTLSYGDLARCVERVSAELTRRSLRKGDVFALLAPNSLEYVLAFQAVLHAGGVVTTINPLSTCAEIAKQLADSNARFCLTTDALAERALEAARGTGVEQLFTTGTHPALAPFAALAAGPPDPALRPRLDPREDVAALPYSSGTTGTQKGVMLTHRNLVANVLQLDTGLVRAHECLVCVLPMFHIYGITAITSIGLHLGATIVVLPRYDLETLLATVQERRVTFLHVVPPILLELAKDPRVAHFDLSSVHTVFSGAAPLAAELSREVGERLGCRVVQGYGMTEASPATHMTPLDPARAEHGTVGAPLASTEARLVDPETGRDVRKGERGEVWVRGPQVMKGYLGRPDATRAAIDADGWLRTGDVGVVTERGNLAIVDRVKELIKCKGFQVAPAELEALLLTHPALADAAVIGVPDRECGEVPKAFVVRRAAVEAAELIAFVAARVAPHKRLRAVEFRERIPKSPSGKILRRVLLAEERARGCGP
jgi:acyl-CoA synthetase (AMP-forming)/AMP-acid ligase II